MLTAAHSHVTTERQVCAADSTDAECTMAHSAQAPKAVYQKHSGTAKHSGKQGFV